MARKMLVLNVATLHPAAVRAHTTHLNALAERGSLRPLGAPVPALTCSSQASMLTGELPRVHGMVGNGWYDREHAKVFMWNRSAHLVGGEPLWEAARRIEPGLRCANLFWRNCADSSCDVIVTERPAYWASGRKTFDFHTVPGPLHGELKRRLGAFPFQRFWGPLAGVASTQWILSAALHVMETQSPELLLVYAPYLDYDAERYGPESAQWTAALKTFDRKVAPLLKAAEAQGRDVAIVSDYGWSKVDRPIMINQALRRAGFLQVERAEHGERLAPGSSRAFAVVDNRIAHVYVRKPEDLSPVRHLLEQLDGVARVLDAEGKAASGIDHARAGDLVAMADEHSWFAYPYWLEEKHAPDFAQCIAIFDKVGSDPTEILMRPGIAGYARLGIRLLQKRLRLAVPFDPCSGDPHRIRASRTTHSGDGLTPGAALITSWPVPQAGPVAMTDLKQLLLRRMFMTQTSSSARTTAAVDRQTDEELAVLA